MVKITSESTSWIIFSCIRLKGPPLSIKPIRLAGTIKQYSMNAMPQEKAMTPINGQFELTPVCESLRCRYHASVMNTLLAISRRMVYNPDIFNCLINKGTRNSTFLLCYSWFCRWLLLAQIIMHCCCSTASVTHCKDNSSTTTNDVSTGKDGGDVGLHAFVYNDGILAT